MITGSHKKEEFIFLEKGVHKKGGSCEPPELAMGLTHSSQKWC